ncbi:MAG: AhpC/TSA family protein, partial [Rikenellaceae bacterium]|nr:AhpC/TSA family protein [Rikenellaceae bacterium]
MKRIFILIAAAVAAVACNSGNIKLDGRLIGCDTTMVYVESLSASFGSKIIDSVRTDERGKFSLKFNAENDQIALYNLNCNGQRIPLLLAKGDAVTVNSVGSIARNYEVSGSEESALLKKVTFLMQDGAARLDSLSSCFAGVTDEGARQQLLKDYTQEYYRIKRGQIQFIVENSSSMAALYALYQRLPNDDVLFNGASDVVYYRMVADSVEARYPASPYLNLVRRDIAT